MALVDLPSGASSLVLEVCPKCSCLWFDTGEMEAVPTASAAHGEKPLPLAARKALALAKVQALQETRNDHPVEDSPSWWQWVLMVLGLPCEVQERGLSRVPWLTWSLLLVMGLVLVASMPQGNATFQRWGFIPNEPGRMLGFTAISSFFLHAGWVHFLGNAYFLAVFGDNVEDVLGRVRFLVLLGVSALAGDMAHSLFCQDPSIPTVGASAGISGILAYYAVTFPRARIMILFFTIWYFRRVSISAAVAFSIWFIIQLLNSLGRTGSFEEVAFVAHLGGAMAGLILAWAWKRPMEDQKLRL